MKTLWKFLNTDRYSPLQLVVAVALAELTFRLAGWC